MATRSRRRLLILVALILIGLALTLVFRYGLTPNLALKVTQHTFGNTIALTVSGFGSLSRASVTVYLVSGQTILRNPIYTIRVESLSYQEGFPGSAIAPLPDLNLPQTIEVTTIYDDGNFNLLRSHQNVAVRVVVEGTWMLGSASFGSVQASAEQCCILPF